MGCMWDVCVVGLGSIAQGVCWSTFPCQKGGLATCERFLRLVLFLDLRPCGLPEIAPEPIL